MRLLARCLSFFLIALLQGCAHFQPGELHASDTDCGKVGSVDVRLRQGVQAWPAIQTCESALAAVSIFADVVSSPWTVELTLGAPGYALQWETAPSPSGIATSQTALEPVPTIGTTYPATRVIEVDARQTWALRHEFGHAYDFENGLPNRRDQRGF